MLLGLRIRSDPFPGKLFTGRRGKLEVPPRRTASSIAAEKASISSSVV